MQRCPLAGSKCGLMVRAKPWEAGEVATLGLLGHGPACVCGSCSCSRSAALLSGRPESEWQHSSGCFPSCKTHMSHTGRKRLPPFFSLSSCLTTVKKTPISLQCPFHFLLFTSHYLLTSPFHPVCTLLPPNLSSSAPDLSNCWGG